MTNQRNNSLAAPGSSLVRTALRLRKPLAWLAAVCLIGAIVAAFLFPPVYRAEAVVLPVSPEGDEGLLAGLASQFGALGSIAGIDLTGDSLAQEAIATLRSRSFTEDFIVERGLLQRIYEDDWDEDEEAWTVDADDVPTLWEAGTDFDEDIRSVIENRRNGLVTVRIEWTDPEEAADWANDLIRRVNARMRQQAVQDAEKSLDYLRRELDKTSVIEIREAIFRLIENQTRKIMIANVREDYAFKFIDPAKPPDEDDFVWPQRFLIVVGGALLAVLLGLAMVLLVDAGATLSQPDERGGRDP